MVSRRHIPALRGKEISMTGGLRQLGAGGGVGIKWRGECTGEKDRKNQDNPYTRAFTSLQTGSSQQRNLRTRVEA